MNLETIMLKAKEVPENVFVFLPKKKAFIYVDGIEYIDDKVIFIFEINLTEDGLGYVTSKHNENDLIRVVLDYNITEDMIIEEVKNKQELENNEN